MRRSGLQRMSLTAGQRVTFAITWITYAGFYFCRKNLSIALPMLAGAAGLHSVKLANIVFGYSLLYAIGQFGFGFLADHVGPKRVVGGGLLLIVASNVMLGLHASVAWLMVFACLNGVGQSTGWSGLVKTMANWFAPENRGVALGAYVAFFDLALGLTAPVAGLIAGQWGYAAIYCFGAVSALISFLLALS